MKKYTFKNFNIADWFSFYRIASAPVLIVLLFLDMRLTFTIFLTASYATDAIDGYLARRLKITSPRGSQLDSMGDQVTFVIGVVSIFLFEFDFVHDRLLWLILALSLYVIQMLLAWKKYGKATAFHTYLAKLSAILQALFILHALYYAPNSKLFDLMIFIGVLETIEEISLIFLHDTWVSDVKSIFFHKHKK